MKPVGKHRVDDLALFGGPQSFEKTVVVGRPNTGEQARLFERLERVLASTWLTNRGPLVREFEERVAELAGVRNCVTTCNATAGLSVLFHTAGLTGEVIMPSMTYVASAHAASFIGLEPVFCDIDPATGCIDPDRVAALITPRTSAILGVHLWGQPCAVDELAGIADASGVQLFFDAAHGVGCDLDGKPIGGFGRAEVFSFHATKIVNAFEGGAVVTDDDDLARDVRSAHSFGYADDGLITLVGTNAKMTEAAAAMGLTSLEAFEESRAANLANHQRYTAEIAGVPGVTVHAYDERNRNNYQYAVIKVDERAGLPRDLLLAVLRAENILAQTYFSPCCHQTPAHRDRRSGPLPVTERLAAQVIALPTGPSIGPDDVARIADVIRLAVANGDDIARRREPVGAA